MNPPHREPEYTNSMFEEHHTIPLVKYVTSTQIGHNGRFGNQLFQFTWLVGVARYLDRKILALPWQPQVLFHMEPFMEFARSLPADLELTPFHQPGYQMTEYDNAPECLNLIGFAQHIGNFVNVMPEILEMWTFRDAFQYPAIPTDAIGVHIRRGDYVTMDIYNYVNEVYYNMAIQYLRNIYPDLPIVFVSDDIKYVKETYLYENAVFVDSGDMFIDFRCFSQCRHRVIGNSTFAWFAAFLNPRHDGQVVMPSPWIQEQVCPQNHLTIPGWHVIHVENKQMEVSRHNFHRKTVGIYRDRIADRKKWMRSVRSFRRVYPWSAIYVLHPIAMFSRFYDKMNITLVETEPVWNDEYVIVMHESYYVCRGVQFGQHFDELCYLMHKGQTLKSDIDAKRGEFGTTYFPSITTHDMTHEWTQYELDLLL